MCASKQTIKWVNSQDSSLSRVDRDVTFCCKKTCVAVFKSDSHCACLVSSRTTGYSIQCNSSTLHYLSSLYLKKRNRKKAVSLRISEERLREKKGKLLKYFLSWKFCENHKQTSKAKTLVSKTDPYRRMKSVRTLEHS